MKQEIEHTALPYKIKQGESLFIGSDSEPVARISPLAGKLKKEANAEFLVLACNSHYELKKIAELTLDKLRAEYMHRDYITNTEKWRNWFCQKSGSDYFLYLSAEKAIAKVQGK